MIRVEGAWLKDEQGRTLILRGVNLGGSSKVPFYPDGATHVRDRFFEHREVSFIGRPFPLHEADEHFSRLQKWGFTFLRLLVPWEAVEHAGPGLYDEAYLDYLAEVVQKAQQHGIILFIDPHQDVWSRFSGGDGAPGWTFEVVGLDVARFKETGAAIVHQTQGDSFPRMIWPTNSGKLAAATMFTLFFGGDDFAPEINVHGEPIQAYLQRHFIGAMMKLAERLKGMSNVAGYDTMNEPISGYIGWEDLEQPGGLLMLGECPGPYQAMLLGSGLAQKVNIYSRGYLGNRVVGSRWMNVEGRRAWLPGVECVWRRHGVWDMDSNGTPHLRKPDYFAHVNGRAVDFGRDYYRPFANRYAQAIRSVHPDALIFLETDPNHKPPIWEQDDARNVVYAPHWYDGFVLFTKQFKSWIAADMHTGKPVFGAGRIRRSFAEQVGGLKRAADERMGGIPTLIGEFGIAFDMKDKEAYHTGDFSDQIRAMDRSFRAMEDNLLGCTLWNYTADNSNAFGDQWNGEDLSIFSRDQQSDPEGPYSGGRALEAAVRPYARAIAGEPLNMEFDYKGGVFEFSFRHDPKVAAPTEIFVPDFQYPHGYEVQTSDGSYEIEYGRQILRYWHGQARPTHYIRLTRTAGKNSHAASDPPPTPVDS